MSIEPQDTPADTGNPNQASIDGLRDVATWLELNPSAAVRFATVHLEGPHWKSTTARETMEAAAVALGPDTEERLEGSGYVTLSREFGGRVSVWISCDSKLLGAKPVAPVYEPILPVDGPEVER